MDTFSPTHIRNLDEAGANVSNGKCHVKAIFAVNTSGAAAFIQVFDAAVASVTLGTTVPRFVIPVAATSGHSEMYFEDQGLEFKTRFSAFSATTAEGNTGSADGVFLQAMVN